MAANIIIKALKQWEKLLDANRRLSSNGEWEDKTRKEIENVYFFLSFHFKYKHDKPQIGRVCDYVTFIGVIWNSRSSNRDQDLNWNLGMIWRFESYDIKIF